MRENVLYFSSTYLPLVFQALPQSKQRQTMKRRLIGLRFVEY